jgi:uroporphyrinogen-III decarboxylase
MIQVGLNQIKMGVDFMFIGGDVAYDKGMFYSPEIWRYFLKPFLTNMCREFKRAKPDIKLIYHGCGNATAIYDELIECGIDAYQTLEVKAGLDVVELKKEYKNKLAFVGNIDTRDILPGDPETMKKDVLRRLNAAKGGGYISNGGAQRSEHGFRRKLRLLYPIDQGVWEISSATWRVRYS